MKTSPRVIISNIIKLFRRIPHMVTCPDCKGKKIIKQYLSNSWVGYRYIKCPKCKGRGTILSSKAKSKGVHNYED